MKIENELTYNLYILTSTKGVDKIKKKESRRNADVIINAYRRNKKRLKNKYSSAGFIWLFALTKEYLLYVPSLRIYFKRVLDTDFSLNTSSIS